VAGIRCLNSKGMLGTDLLGTLNKMNHRYEMLIMISTKQETMGYHEMGKAYRNQAMELKRFIESIHNILTVIS
jgi:hypothetical protein